MELENIKRGFNQGYDLKRLHPALAQQLYKSFGELSLRNEYQDAYIKGFEQADMEHSREKSGTRHFSLGKSAPLSEREPSKNKELGDREI